MGKRRRGVLHVNSPQKAQATRDSKTHLQEDFHHFAGESQSSGDQLGSNVSHQEANPETSSLCAELHAAPGGVRAVQIKTFQCIIQGRWAEAVPTGEKPPRSNMAEAGMGVGVSHGTGCASAHLLLSTSTESSPLLLSLCPIVTVVPIRCEPRNSSPGH